MPIRPGPIGLVGLFALAACAALGGGGRTSVAIEVDNDRPRAGFIEHDARITIVPVGEPERERFLGTVPRGERRVFPIIEDPDGLPRTE